MVFNFLISYKPRKLILKFILLFYDKNIDVAMKIVVGRGIKFICGLVFVMPNSLKIF